MPEDPFVDLRDHLHAAVNDAIAGLDYSHSQLLGQQISALSHNADAFLPALLCVLTAETLGAHRDAALAAGTALALAEASAYVVDDLVNAGSGADISPRGLMHLWGMPRTLNAADGFFALAHEQILTLADQGFEAGMVLSLAAELDAGCRAWSEESEARFAAGRMETSHPSSALLFAAGCIGGRLGGLDAAEAGSLASTMTDTQADLSGAAPISSSAAATLSDAMAYLAGVAKP